VKSANGNIEESTMKISRVGIDLAKNVFQLQGVDHKGKAVWKRRLKRDKWLNVLCQSVDPGCEVGMEACADDGKTHAR